jgi:hypothetical protein
MPSVVCPSLSDFPAFPPVPGRYVGASAVGARYPLRMTFRYFR